MQKYICRKKITSIVSLSKCNGTFLCSHFEISIQQMLVESLVKAGYGSYTEVALPGRRNICLAENHLLE